MTFWVANWLRAFGVTWLIEALVAVPLLGRLEPRLPRRLAGVTLVNLATHPLVWFAFPGLALTRGPRVALSELFAVTVETVGYATLWTGANPAQTWRRSAIVSLAANAASFALGALAQARGWL